MEVKIVGEIDLSDGRSSWVEIQVVLMNNKNETGFSHHAIFDAKKVLLAMIEIQGYVSEIYVRNVIKEMLRNNPNIRIKEELILEEFKSFLMKMQLSWRD